MAAIITDGFVGQLACVTCFKFNVFKQYMSDVSLSSLYTLAFRSSENL